MGDWINLIFLLQLNDIAFHYSPVELNQACLNALDRLNQSSDKKKGKGGKGGKGAASKKEPPQEQKEEPAERKIVALTSNDVKFDASTLDKCEQVPQKLHAVISRILDPTRAGMLGTICRSSAGGFGAASQYAASRSVQNCIILYLLQSTTNLFNFLFPSALATQSAPMWPCF